ncbi:MAG: protocatechuate 3,4-dioxygenase [Halopseudomonas sp.]
MTTPTQLSRRALLQAGLCSAAGAVSGNLFAQTSADTVRVTPTQTAGPFFPKHQQVDKDLDLTRIKGHTQRAEGELIYLSGQVLDDHNRPISGALIDIWQANTYGRYHHEDDPNPAPLDENFQGWGQFKTDQRGYYRFKTIIPGAYPVSNTWWRPPHIHFKVAKRGYHQLTTQMYFAGNELNNKDRLLLELPVSKQEKLIVKFSLDAAAVEPGAKRGLFNMVLRQVEDSSA